MTIAACYLSSEGVVFGADSTTTMFVSAPVRGAKGMEHHYNYAQKIFEIGDHSTLAIAVWGLGNLPQTSYRTLIAQFADSISAQGVQRMADVANQWNQFFWSVYSTEQQQVLHRARVLHGQAARSREEQEELDFLLQAFSGGFCLGGYVMNDRTPSAFEIKYDPTMTAPAPVDPLSTGSTRFWGCPNLIHRLIYGIDFQVLGAVLESGKWSGSNEELFALVGPHCLGQPHDLPIREAIDWLHASIYTTNKTMKFSHMAPVCGGPVEVAVITTDRPFRWVRHKRFDAAIEEGGLV